MDDGKLQSLRSLSTSYIDKISKQHELSSLSHCIRMKIDLTSVLEFIYNFSNIIHEKLNTDRINEQKKVYNNPNLQDFVRSVYRV